MLPCGGTRCSTNLLATKIHALSYVCTASISSTGRVRCNVFTSAGESKCTGHQTVHMAAAPRREGVPLLPTNPEVFFMFVSLS